MSGTLPVVSVGDWVRFMLSGRLVIGQVMYVHESEVTWATQNVVTDTGTVYNNAILEVRSPHVPNQVPEPGPTHYSLLKGGEPEMFYSAKPGIENFSRKKDDDR